MEANSRPFAFSFAGALCACSTRGMAGCMAANQRGAPAEGVFLTGGRAVDAQQDEIASCPMICAWWMWRRSARGHAALSNVPVWRIEKRPHVTVDRVTSSSTIFHVEGSASAGNVGSGSAFNGAGPTKLWAIQHSPIARWWSNCLCTWATMGWEANAAAAAANSTWQRRAGPFDLPDATPGKAAWLLSRVSAPAPRTTRPLHGESVAYQITLVAGWLRLLDHPAQRRKRLYMLEEGSWIAPTGALVGSTQDVRPAPFESGEAFSHPVYRYGYGLAVGTPRECTHG